jgi:hypothetical protein
MVQRQGSDLVGVWRRRHQETGAVCKASMNI